MKTFRTLLTLVALALLSTLSAAAQSGCINSPENPTAVLFLIGATAAAIPAARSRLSRLRSMNAQSRAASSATK